MSTHFDPELLARLSRPFELGFEVFYTSTERYAFYFRDAAGGWHLCRDYPDRSAAAARATMHSFVATIGANTQIPLRLTPTHLNAL